MTDRILKYNKIKERVPQEIVIDDDQLTAFGDVRTAHLTPIVQIDATSGLRVGSDTEIFTSGTGSAATIEDTGTGYEFKCSSGTDVGGYGIIKSREAVRYRPGQGTILRWTARFDTPIASHLMRAGGINAGVELSFGYNGTQFGILYRTGGKQEIRDLTITTPAAGAETWAIELDGTTYNVSVTAGTAAHNTFEIASDSQFGTDQAWDAYQNDGKVTFIKNSIGVVSGNFSFSSGAGAGVASFSQIEAGAAAIDEFINQEDWNIDPMIATPENSSVGNGPSRQVLNPQNGNVYQVRFQYLGYGAIEFGVEDANSSRMQTVHRITYANNNSSPSLLIPHLKLGWFSASAGSTTNKSIYGSSAMGGIEGNVSFFRNPFTDGHSKTSIGTTLTSIVAIRVRREFNDQINLYHAILNHITLGVEGTKPVLYKLVLNPTLGGEPNWTYTSEELSVVEYDHSATTVTGGQVLFSGGLAKSDSTDIELADLHITLVPGDIVTLAIQATSGTADVTAGIVWHEE